jgi:hypothetical protein
VISGSFIQRRKRRPETVDMNGWNLLLVRARHIEYEPRRVSPRFPPHARAAAAVPVRALASGTESAAYSVRCLRVRVRRLQRHDTAPMWGRKTSLSGQRPSTCSSCSWPRSRCTVTGPPRLDHATLWLRNRTHVVCARRPPGKIQRATGVGCSLADADRCPARARKGTGKHLRISGAATSRSIRYHERVISREDAGLAPLHRCLQCNK